MNLVYRHLDQTGHVILFNIGTCNRLVLGKWIKSGKGISITVEVANVIKNIISGWGRIVRFTDHDAYIKDKKGEI